MEPSPAPAEPATVLPGPLDQTQISAYVNDGFLVVPGVLSDADVEQGRREAARFARGEYPVHGVPDLPADATDDEAMARLLAVHFPHWTSEVTLELMKHPGVCAILGQITGAHLPFWDGRVKCFQSMLFVKPPGLPGQSWHQDERFIPTRDRSLVGAWMALDDATLENGCLRVIPGSHRTGEIFPFRPHDRPDEFDGADESYGFDESGEIPVEVEAGDVVFFNGYLLHRSFRNRSDRYRRALVGHYLNSWSLLPFMPAKGDMVATNDFRTVVPVVGDDPYEWRGYADPPWPTFVRPVDRKPGVRST